MENIRVRAIIQFNDGIVFIHRIRNVNNKVCEYFPLPGGGVESDESLEEGLVREVKEELGLTVNIIKKLYKIIDDKSIQYIYLCNYVSGVFGTGDGPEFSDKVYSNRGKYIPEVVKFNDLVNTNIVPIELKEQLLEDLSKNTLEEIDYKEIKIINTIVM